MENNSIFTTVNGVETHYHHEGQGEPILFIHGSGPGVSAWANWRLVFPILSPKFELFAPDLVGFGSTKAPEDCAFGVDTWVNHLLQFIDQVIGKPVYLVGNSLGGALALHIAHRRPEMVKKMVLMGTVGIRFPISEGLDKVWGYEPSIENMKELLGIFSYDQSAVNDDLAELRYKASIQPGVQEAFSKMFPAPRQRHVDALALSEQQIAGIEVPTLLVHGREDRVIPYKETSAKIFELLPNAELHVFSKCGHWTQIEKTKPFTQLVANFFS